MRALDMLLAAAFVASGVAAQSAEPRFEVASVKPAEPGRPQGVWTDGSPGRIRIQRLTLKALIAGSYEIRGFQVFGPGWIDSERYDIMAKLPDEAAKLGEKERWSQVHSMERSLLADRFQLAAHRETRDLPVLTLVVAKGGLKIRKTGEDEGSNVIVERRAGHLAAQQITVRQIVEILSSIARQPVLDATGFAGATDIRLDWTPEDNDPVGPLSDALHQQLGLKLEERKSPMPVVVIDRVERPSGN